MNHYETLDVQRDATADEIKQAWRRKASENHPDRDGGNPELMAAVNRAYEILGDPARRASYDASGSDELPKPLDLEARNALMTMFQAALDDGSENILVAMGTMLDAHRRGLEQIRTNALTKSARLMKRSGKIKVKKGDNLVQMLIDQQVKQIDEQLQKLEGGLKVNARCAEMLRDYEQEAEPARQPVQQQFQQNAYGSFQQLTGFFPGGR